MIIGPHYRLLSKAFPSDAARTNLWQCLRGSALAWWTSILSDVEKQIIETSGDGLAIWEKYLTERSAVDQAQAMRESHGSRYSILDARNNVDPRDFAAKMLRAAKVVNMDNVYNQLTLLYNAIDVVHPRPYYRQRPSSTWRGTSLRRKGNHTQILQMVISEVMNIYAYHHALLFDPEEASAKLREQKLKNTDMTIQPLIAEPTVHDGSHSSAVAVCEHRGLLPGLQGYSANNEGLTNNQCAEAYLGH